MSFTDQADARIKAALETALRQSTEAAQRELEAFRTTFEARYDVGVASLAATYEALNSAMQTELIADLTRLADEEARAVAGAVRREVLEQSQRQLETERLDMRGRLDAARAEARAQLEVERAAGRDALAAAQANARAELEAGQAMLRAELEADTAEKVGALTDALEGAQAEIVRLHTQGEAQHQTSLAQVNAAHAEAEAARAETSVLIEAQAQLERALAELRAELQTERASNVALSRELERVRVGAEQARKEAEGARQCALTQRVDAPAHAEVVKSDTPAPDSATDTPENWVEATLAPVGAPSADGLLDAFLAIDAAKSLGGVLDALLEHLAVEFSRAALFVIQGDRLHGWRSVGFHDPATVLQQFEGPLTADSLLTRAVRRRQPMASDDLLTTTGFSTGAAARLTAAFPICVAESVVAVAYVDTDQATGDDQAPARRLRIAETLVSHAAHRLTTRLAMSHAIPQPQ